MKKKMMYLAIGLLVGMGNVWAMTDNQGGGGVSHGAPVSDLSSAVSNLSQRLAQLEAKDQKRSTWGSILAGAAAGRHAAGKLGESNAKLTPNQRLVINVGGTVLGAAAGCATYHKIAEKPAVVVASGKTGQAKSMPRRYQFGIGAATVLGLGVTYLGVRNRNWSPAAKEVTVLGGGTLLGSLACKYARSK